MPRQIAKTEDGARDYTHYAEKEVTEVMKDFHAWLQKVTGLKLDLKSVALGGTLRMDYQKAARDNGSERSRSSAGTAKPAAKPKAAATPAKSKPAPAKAPVSKRGTAKAATAPPAKPAASSGRRGRVPTTAGARGKIATTDEAPY
jgi:hypothetical protein